jgi:hypothetical protein
MSVPYFMAIHGRLLVIGYEPDGDSVRFVAEQPSSYADLHRGYKIRPSTRDGSVQLRLEGIDAPELHYGSAAQPLGATSRDALMGAIGFGDLTYRTGSTAVTAATPESVPAVIYTKAADPHGRPISYLQVEPGHRAKDGGWSQVTTAVLDRTVNVHALRTGMAYPLFYTSTPASHVRHLRGQARVARDGDHGVWAHDHTGLFRLHDQASIGPHGALIMPKLFRRSTDYLKDVAAGFRGNLPEWLRANNTGSRHEDDLVVLPGGVEVPLSALLEQRNASIAFTPDLLDIMFVEK